MPCYETPQNTAPHKKRPECNLHETCVKYLLTPLSCVNYPLTPISCVNYPLTSNSFQSFFLILVLSFCIGKFLCYFLLTTTARDPIATWRRCLGDWLVAADAVLHDTYLGDRLVAPHTSHQSTGLQTLQTSGVFTAFWKVAKRFLDPVTAEKITFISGDTSPGSANDARLIRILGENWRQLTRQDEAVCEKGGSRGYVHAAAWAQAEQEELLWLNMLQHTASPL